MTQKAMLIHIADSSEVEIELGCCCNGVFGNVYRILREIFSSS